MSDVAERMAERAERAVTVMTDEDWTPDLPVHPAAAVFPMLAEDRLRALAESIQENGLLYPIVLDREGVLIAGRNRLAACRIAGVEPTFMVLPDGVDPVAYVLAENFERRQMGPGQRAMAAAKVECNAHYSTRRLATIANVGHTAIAQSRLILRDAPGLVEQVEAGASLYATYRLAVERKEAAIERERTRLDDEARQVERLAEIEAERDRLIAGVRAAQEAFGEPVELPPEPDLAINLASDDAAPAEIVPFLPLDSEMFASQENLLGRMRQVRTALEKLSAETVPSTSAMFEGHVVAVRSWATQVISLVYGLVDSYNAALDEQTRVRRVK